jgi:tetratricopeptide (TPR) repeat protein
LPAEPTFADAYYERGAAYYDLQRHDQAGADLTRAAEIAPGWAEPRVALGRTYYAEKRLQEAARVRVRASTTRSTQLSGSALDLQVVVVGPRR